MHAIKTVRKIDGGPTHYVVRSTADIRDLLLAPDSNAPRSSPGSARCLAAVSVRPEDRQEAQRILTDLLFDEGPLRIVRLTPERHSTVVAVLPHRRYKD